MGVKVGQHPLGAVAPPDAEDPPDGVVQKGVGEVPGPWYALDTRGAVLFLEDIGERPYRLDGMLTHLRNSGQLEQCAAILLGAFTDCQAEDPSRSLTSTRQPQRASSASSQGDSGRR